MYGLPRDSENLIGGSDHLKRNLTMLEEIRIFLLSPKCKIMMRIPIPPLSHEMSHKHAPCLIEATVVEMVGEGTPRSLGSIFQGNRF